MKSQFDYILKYIAQRGQSNREAITAHRSAKAGERGVLMAQEPTRKRGLQGIAGPRRKRVKTHSSPVLMARREYGTPIKTDGSTGYMRDPITGVITRCVATGK